MNPNSFLNLSPEERDSLKELLSRFEEFNRVVTRTKDGLTRFFGTSNPVTWAGPAESEHLQRLRANHSRAYSAWTHEEETLLLAIIQLDYPLTLISYLTGRSLNAVRSKIRKLNETDAPEDGSNPVTAQHSIAEAERGFDRGPQSLNKHGMVNPPPTGGIARDTI